MQVLFCLTFCLVSIRRSSSYRTYSGPQLDGRIFVNHCEINILRLDYINHAAGAEGLVIVIARLAEGEKATWSHRRLHNVRVHLQEFLGRKPETIVTAYGNPAKGKPVVEVYIKGDPPERFYADRHEDIFVGSCESQAPEDKGLYDSRRRRRERK